MQVQELSALQIKISVGSIIDGLAIFTYHKKKLQSLIM